MVHARPFAKIERNEPAGRLILQGGAVIDPSDRRPRSMQSDCVSTLEHRLAAEPRAELHLGMQSRTDEDEKHRKEGFRSHVVIF